MNEITNKPLAGFNKEQQEAIEAKSDHNILISAGAGSGKTKTLSERVFRLIESGEIAPSQLLVLTFTNNAAHEMKERIIARFKAGNSRLAEEMPSAHVQTFDSFSQYLISTYAGRLGIANQIFVANDSVMAAKKAEMLDALFDRYYNDPLLLKRLLPTLTKLNTKDDRRLKKIVLDLDDQLQKMLPSDRKEFIDNYDKTFLSKEAYRRFLEIFLDDQKTLILKELYRSRFLEKYYDDLDPQERTPEKLKIMFSDKRVFSDDYENAYFADQVFCAPLYEAVANLLPLEGMDFVKAVKGFARQYPHLVALPKAKELEDPSSLKKVKAVCDRLRKLFATKSPTLKEVLDMDGTDEENYALILSFREDIHLLFDLVNELETRLFDYKKSINTFTFSDISLMALRLVTEPQFADIAENLRARFKYIMVDEYQDTNDFQEAFINSLLKPDKNGDRAHLFCVGDAKQSIYGFRNSNVELFRARQAEYEASPNDKVIHMNRNYRSGKPLLQEINYLFSSFMRPDHGSIDYKNPNEQLRYDDEADIYGDIGGRPFGGFGIYRLIPENEKGGNDIEWEAHAIIDTIKDMVGRGYPVYDRSCPEKVRPCCYRDFAILMRKKKAFPLYQRLFSEAGIPLNVSVSANLREIDAIILLQSIVSLVAWRQFGVKADVKHLFASVARSYAYQYSDEQIYNLIAYKAPDGVDTENPDRDLGPILQDPIMVTLDSFCKGHWRSSFSTIFLDLLTTFHVIERLHLIGAVNENVAKIESLYQMVLSEEKAGEGLKEFVHLFQTIRKHELDLKTDSDFQIENSVDLMTIHASKGLERKIIMMPVSFNGLAKGNATTKPDYDFSRDEGILLPNYVLFQKKGKKGEGMEEEDPSPEKTEGVVHHIGYKCFGINKKKNNLEIDEHVRLLYVALTRAENSIYFVGSDPKENESLYELLNSVPHYWAFHERMIQEKLAKKVVDQSLYDRYLELCDTSQNLRLPLTPNELSPQVYPIYESFGKEYFVETVKSDLNGVVKDICYQLYLDYHHFAKARFSGDLDFYARLFGAWKYPSAGIANFVDLQKHIHKESDEDEDEKAPPSSELLTSADESSAEGNEQQASYALVSTGGNLEAFLKAFGDAVLQEDYLVFGLEVSAKSKDPETEIRQKMAETFLSAYAQAIDAYPYVRMVSYASALYPDHTATYRWDEKWEADLFDPELTKLKPQQINDQPIPFAAREKKRASKSFVPVDDDSPIRELLDRGVHLHRLMELIDWKTRDVSFITDPNDRHLVEGVLGLPLFQSTGAERYLSEFGYYDEDLKTTGFIDLIIVKDGTCSIVDWKTSDIDDRHYEDQLRIYQRNVQRIFGIDKDAIKLYLVSLTDKRVREIAAE